jgi:hypothetical protein
MSLLQLLIYQTALNSKKEVSIGQMSNYMNTDSFNIEYTSELIVSLCTPLQLLGSFLFASIFEVNLIFSFRCSPWI